MKFNFGPRANINTKSESVFSTSESHSNCYNKMLWFLKWYTAVH